MGKKITLIGIIVVLMAFGIWYIFFNKSNSSLVNPISQIAQKPSPSETFLEYSDPSGFSFSYPDNLSIEKAEVDENTYADLILSSKDVSGSLNLKITDSKFKNLDEWVKLNKEASIGEPREVKLGNLKALELTTTDRTLMGSLDQGIFFSIEMPLIEKEFWSKVYNKLLSDFSFEPPTAATGDAGGEVIFEGEEVVE